MGFGNFRNALFGGAAVAAMAAAATPASAVVVDFGFAASSTTSITYTPNGPIGDANSVINMNTIPSYNNPSVQGDDTTGINHTGNPISIAWSSPINFVPGTQTLSTPVTETFKASSGTYSATFTALFAPAPQASTNLGLVFEGKLTTPGTLTQNVFLSASFTNVSNSNTTATSVSFTETSSPPPVIGTPEPASMAVLGVALAGLGAARRRKRQG